MTTVTSEKATRLHERGSQVLRARGYLCFAAMLLFVFVAGCGSRSKIPDPIVSSFAYMADNQIGAAAWMATKTQNPSSANLPQLKQFFTDLAHVSPVPQFVAIGGDLVMNEIMDNGQTLRTQLNAWQTFKASCADARSLDLVLLNGNHETNLYDSALSTQFPNEPAFDVWLNWLAANGYDGRAGNGPTPASSPSDLLVRDESRLTYSFDEGSSHFVVINTDTRSTVENPITGKPCTGWIALDWIENDIRNAQANGSINSIFVIGHKPIEHPSFAAGDTDGIINTADHPLASGLAALMRENSKVRAYICSHVHVYSAFRLEGGTGVWQIIVGNGGAQPDARWSPASDQDFGFAVFNIHQSGKVSVIRYGRPVPPAPQKFYEDSPVPPPAAVPKSELVIESRS